MSNKLIINDELDDLFSDLEENPEFQDAQADLEPGYQITRHRLAQGLTQAELADLVGTSQSSIARLENSTKPPSLSFLRRVAQALDANVEVKVTANTISDSEENDGDVLFETICYLHEDAYEDIQQENHFDAHNKLETIIKLIERCEPSKEIELLSIIIQRDLQILDQLARSGNSSAVQTSNLQAGLLSLRNDLDNFIEKINDDQRLWQRSNVRVSLSELAYQRDALPPTENPSYAIQQSDQD